MRVGPPGRRWRESPEPRPPIRTQHLASPNPTSRSNPNPTLWPSSNNPNPTSRPSPGNPNPTSRSNPNPTSCAPSCRRCAGGRVGFRPIRRVRRKYYRDPCGRLTHNLPVGDRFSRSPGVRRHPLGPAKPAELALERPGKPPKRIEFRSKRGRNRPESAKNWASDGTLRGKRNGTWVTSQDGQGPGRSCPESRPPPSGSACPRRSDGSRIRVLRAS